MTRRLQAGAIVTCRGPLCPRLLPQSLPFRFWSSAVSRRSLRRRHQPERPTCPSATRRTFPPGLAFR
jgi:hypothetical protein